MRQAILRIEILGQVLSIVVFAKESHGLDHLSVVFS